MHIKLLENHEEPAKVISTKVKEFCMQKHTFRFHWQASNLDLGVS